MQLQDFLLNLELVAINGENGIDAERYIWPFIDELVGTAEQGDPNLVYQWKVNGENPVNTTTRTVSGQNTRIVTINDTCCRNSYCGM